jgi:hypothetical protein
MLLVHVQPLLDETIRRHRPLHLFRMSLPAR